MFSYNQIHWWTKKHLHYNHKLKLLGAVLIFLIIMKNPYVKVSICPVLLPKSAVFEKSYIWKTIFWTTFLNTSCLRFNIILTPGCNWMQCLVNTGLNLGVCVHSLKVCTIINLSTRGQKDANKILCLFSF